MLIRLALLLLALLGHGALGGPGQSFPRQWDFAPPDAIWPPPAAMRRRGRGSLLFFGPAAGLCCLATGA